MANKILNCSNFRFKFFIYTSLIVVLSVIINLFSGVVPVHSSTPVTAEYLGTNTETKGNWVGTYGSEGYMLPFFAATVASGRQTPTPADVYRLPSYVSSYGNDPGYWVTYNVTQNPSTDARALKSPQGDIRKMLSVYQASPSVQYTFNLTDNSEHMFTVYSCDFRNTDIVTQQIQILDLNNNVLDTQVIKSINNGKYVSYIVKGSFRFRIMGLQGSSSFPTAFFFDSIPNNTITDVQLSYEAPRKAKLSWNNTDQNNKVSILRKKAGETNFSEIAKIDGKISQYLDQNLDTGVTYYYKLRSVNNYKYSPSTAQYSVQIPAYRNTSLTFLDTSLSVDKPGQEIVIRAKLSTQDGSPLAGREVSFQLQGQYVGKFIDSHIGSVVTNENGIAEISYIPSYAGDFEIKGYFPPDDMELLTTSTAIIPLTVKVEAWKQSPKILHVSDAVKPGKLLTVNGYGIHGDIVEIAIDKAFGAVPPSSAKQLEIVQTDRNSFFTVARLSQDMKPGVYHIWVKNEYGWSEPILLNASRPKFISEYEAFEGQIIKLVGRNLDGLEFGAQRDTMIRLVDNAGKIQQSPIVEVNPFAVSFKISGVPVGEYWVEVSNDGGLNWVRLENGQKLKVVNQGQDPLGLGVAWANNFNWNATFNVQEYGALPNDDADDTAAVQAAVNTAKQDGGGVVYFPSGRYLISRIDLPSGVVLLGEDKYNTELIYTSSGANFINSAGDGKTIGRQGIARLSLKVLPMGAWPDSFIWLGHDWGIARSDMNFRTAAEFFVHEVNLDYSLDQKATGGRGLGLIIIAKERFIFTNNYFKGWAANPNRVIVSEYSTVSNNYIEYNYGYVSTAFAYSFTENNHIIMNPQSQLDQHGISSAGNSYIYNNTIENAGRGSSLNDGEPIMVEMPGGYHNYGEILKASDKELIVGPAFDLNKPTISGEFIGVVIVGGRGLGQYRKVTEIVGNKIIVDEPWDIVPDRTSKFTLIIPKENITFYKNTVKNSAKGIWFYGNAIDGVASKNISKDSEGIFVASSHVPNQQRFVPNYYIRIVDNEITGVSPRSKHAGIGYSASGTNFATQAYGIEIRDNRIVGEPAAVPNNSTECPPISGIFAYVNDIQGNYNGTNMIVENNILENLNTGITLNKGAYGQIISGNLHRNVSILIDDKGSQNTILENNGEFDDQTPPVTTAIVSGSFKNGWYISNVSIQLSAVDDITGVKKTEYSFDGGSTWHEYSVPIILNEDGSYTLYYRSVDRVGNIESVKEKKLDILKTPPDTLIQELITKINKTGMEDGIKNSLTVKLQNALKSLINNKNSTINQLNAFINEISALTDEKLTQEQYSEIIAAVKKIIIAINLTK